MEVGFDLVKRHVNRVRTGQKVAVLNGGWVSQGDGSPFGQIRAGRPESQNPCEESSRRLNSRSGGE